MHLRGTLLHLFKQVVQREVILIFHSMYQLYKVIVWELIDQIVVNLKFMMIGHLDRV